MEWMVSEQLKMCLDGLRYYLCACKITNLITMNFSATNMRFLVDDVGRDQELQGGLSSVGWRIS